MAFLQSTLLLGAYLQTEANKNEEPLARIPVTGKPSVPTLTP